MVEFLYGLWIFLSSFFSGCGNIIFGKLLKKVRSKKHNKKDKSFSDKDIILDAINYHGSSKQREIFMRYFYKYKKYFADDDVKNLTQKLEEDHPNYNILLNILLGLIESLNQN